MPILAAKLKMAIKTRVFNGFKQKFADMKKDNPDAEKNWEAQADIIAEIAEDICQMLLTDVQVAPNIPVITAGSPATQSGVTTAPGKLI